MFQETARLVGPVGPGWTMFVVVAHRLWLTGCLRTLPTQIVGAALVLGFPIHQGILAAVAVPSVQVVRELVRAEVFPALVVAEVLLLSSEFPSHHPFP